MTRKLAPDDFAPNRRAEPRLAAARTIEVLPCKATATQWGFMPAELTDCSLHGLGLLLPEPMDVGQQFLAKLKARDRVRLLLYTVHNCAQQDRSRYRIGARFSGFAAQEFDEDLQAVLDGLSGRA
ncbi:MAG: PilZ domain-containing protein [Tepidisphaeraceae bacterium]